MSGSHNAIVGTDANESELHREASSVTGHTHSLGFAWVVWGAAALFYLYEYILRVSPGVMTNELMRDFGVTSTALGILASAYYFSYVPLQIPCGMIVDWLGTRRVVTFSAVLCAIGSFMFAKSDTVLMASSARFIMGAGSACAYLSCLKVSAEWFPVHRFAVIAGITQMMGIFGAMFGGKPMAMLVNTMNWQSTMLLAGFVGILVALASWIIIRDHPQGDEHFSKQQDIMTFQSLLNGLKVVTSSSQTWLIGIYAGLMYMLLSTFAELWGIPYLMVTYEINNETAAYGSMLVFIGMAVGCFVSPLLANYLKSHKKVMSMGALGCCALFVPAVYFPDMPLYGVFTLLFGSGFFCGWQILNFAAAKEINPPEFSGTTIGFSNALVMVTALIFQPLLGKLIDLYEVGVLGPDGVVAYSAEAYQYSFLAVIASLVLAWIIMQFVHETHPDNIASKKFQKNNLEFAPVNS